MKATIEINDAEIEVMAREALKTAIRNRVNGWGASSEIERVVKNAWHEALEKVVSDELQNLPKLREMVREEITKKLRRQIAALTKEVKNAPWEREFEIVNAEVPE